MSYLRAVLGPQNIKCCPWLCFSLVSLPFIHDASVLCIFCLLHTNATSHVMLNYFVGVSVCHSFKLQLGMIVSHVQIFQIWPSLLLMCAMGVAQIVELLPLALETRMYFWAPYFCLTELKLLQAFGGAGNKPSWCKKSLFIYFFVTLFISLIAIKNENYKL